MIAGYFYDLSMIPMIFPWYSHYRKLLSYIPILSHENRLIHDLSASKNQVHRVKVDRWTTSLAAQESAEDGYSGVIIPT
jgi:hypothetical protein